MLFHIFTRFHIRYETSNTVNLLAAILCKELCYYSSGNSKFSFQISDKFNKREKQVNFWRWISVSTVFFLSSQQRKSSKRRNQRNRKLFQFPNGEKTQRLCCRSSHTCDPIIRGVGLLCEARTLYHSLTRSSNVCSAVLACVQMQLDRIAAIGCITTPLPFHRRTHVHRCT